MLIQINSNDLQPLVSLGISSATIAKIINARNQGLVFKSNTDLENIGITASELSLLANNISFDTSPGNSQIVTVSIETEPHHLLEYQLYVRYQDKNTGELVQDIYFIDTDGKTPIRYNDQIAAEPITLIVKAPDGSVVETGALGKKSAEHQFTKEQLKQALLRIHKLKEVQTSPGIVGKPLRLRGKLIAADTSLKLEKIQIVFSVATSLDENNIPEYYPVGYAETETDGYFFSSQLNFRSPEDYNRLLHAKAQIAIDGNPEIFIRLQSSDDTAEDAINQQLPERIILFLEDQPVTEATAESDCGCNDCTDLDFHAKKVLDEFSYYTVVRTTEPIIKAVEVADVEEVELADVLDGIVSDSKIRDKVAGLKIGRAFLRSFVDRHGVITGGNVNNLIQQIQSEKLKSKLHKKPKAFNGRLSLDGNYSVDWDDKPTIYEAVSISHGHLLHFKQEWTADGYSMGDLLYSLPLAPGQKKQIVVFDWDRKDSASNTQQLDYQESLYNNLSRDRDVSEIAKSVVKEKSFGASLAGAGGKASGSSGGILQTLISGVSGIASGFGLAGSIAGQTASRRATASSQQHVNDRTVQSANAVRSQRSTVIQTASQGERFEVSAESVANYNHCHAMTIQYFEVLRHFQVNTRLADVQECLFIPLELSPFDRKKAMRWREILAAALINPDLEPGFSATERIDDELASANENYYESIGYPNHNYAEKELIYVEGELQVEFQLERPLDKIDENGKPVFDEPAWAFFQTFLGGLQPGAFYERFLKNQEQKDEKFFKHAGPSIAQEILGSLKFYAVKRNHQQDVKLPIDVTLLSTFGNRKKLNVSLRFGGKFNQSVKREDIDFIEIRMDEAKADKIINLMRSSVRVIVHAGTMQYNTELSSDFLFKNANIKNDLTTNDPEDTVRIYAPLNANELRNPRKEDVLVSNALLHHLNENLEYYHQAIWMNMDEQRRFMLLDGIIAPGKANGRSVASVVENKLIGVVGNCLVMPVAPGLQLDPTLDGEVDLFQHYYADPLDPLRLSLPTKGVFAEAVMGKCNSCEKKDETRFWRWDEAPIPDSPTTINAINTPVPQNVQQNLQPKDFAAPIINLQNAPNLPDPQGYNSLVQLLSNPNLFRDMTGLSENQKNALQAFQSSMTGAQNFASMSKDLATQHANQVNSQAMVEAIRNAPELTKDEKAQLIKDHFRQMIDGGETKRKEQEASATNSKTGLSEVAARAEEKGKSVKASSVDPTTGKMETLEVGPGDGTVFRIPNEIPWISQGVKTNACWAAAATMMKSWKDKKKYKIEEVLSMAGEEYISKYRSNLPLFANEKPEFIGLLGMVGEDGVGLTLKTLIDWLKTYGALWVTVDSDSTEGISIHAKIIFGFDGNGNEESTKLIYLDPAQSGEKKEFFTDFISEFNELVNSNPNADSFIQVVHFNETLTGEIGEGAANHASIINANIPSFEDRMIVNTREIKAITNFKNWLSPDSDHNTHKRGVRNGSDIKLLILHETASLSLRREASSNGYAASAANNWASAHFGISKDAVVYQFNDVMQHLAHIHDVTHGTINKSAIGIEFASMAWVGESISRNRSEWNSNQALKNRYPEGDDFFYCFWGDGHGVLRIPSSIEQLEKAVEMVRFLAYNLPDTIKAFRLGGMQQDEARIKLSDWLTIYPEDVNQSVVDELFVIEPNWLQVVSYNEISNIWEFDEITQIPDDSAKGDKNLFVFSTGYGYLDENRIASMSGIISHSALRGNHQDGGFVALYCWLRLEKQYTDEDAYAIARRLISDYAIISITQKFPSNNGHPVYLIDVSFDKLNNIYQAIHSV